VRLSGSRAAYRHFRYSHKQRARSPQPNPTMILGRATDAEVPLPGIESGAITNVSPRIGCRYSLDSRRCVATAGPKNIGRSTDFRLN
jgi:hypothetical protein